MALRQRASVGAAVLRLLTLAGGQLAMGFTLVALGALALIVVYLLIAWWGGASIAKQGALDWWHP